MLRDLTMRSLPDEVRSRFTDLRASGLAVPNRGALVEARRMAHLEIRSTEDGGTGLAGYAASWETTYDVAGGPDHGGWTETMAAGSGTKSLREQRDVRFLINHDGLPLARTKSGTLTLSSDEVGLLVEVNSLDATNPRVAELVSALRRGDVDQMSHAFMVTRQEWNKDYTERRITEYVQYDVSAVTYPANEATVIGLRSEPPVALERGFPLALALAQAEALALG